MNALLYCSNYPVMPVQVTIDETVKIIKIHGGVVITASKVWRYAPYGLLMLPVSFQPR